MTPQANPEAAQLVVAYTGTRALHEDSRAKPAEDLANAMQTESQVHSVGVRPKVKKAPGQLCNPPSFRIDGKSKLTRQLAKTLTLQRRKKNYTNIFLGNLLLNDFYKKITPLHFFIENSLKGNKWYSMIRKLTKILQIMGYWEYKPKSELLDKIKKNTKNEDSRMGCIMREESLLQHNFKTNMTKISEIKREVVKLEQNPEKNPEEIEVIASLKQYMDQQSYVVKAIAFALKHRERRYVHYMQYYYTVCKEITMYVIKNNTKIRIISDTRRDFDPIQSLCETTYWLQTQYYFLDRIGWWTTKPTSPAPIATARE